MSAAVLFHWFSDSMAFFVFLNIAEIVSFNIFTENKFKLRFEYFQTWLEPNLVVHYDIINIKEQKQKPHLS